jgi:hypothetical protein
MYHRTDDSFSATSGPALRCAELTKQSVELTRGEWANPAGRIATSWVRGTGAWRPPIVS